MSHINQLPCASSFTSASKTLAVTLDEINAQESCRTEIERSLSAQNNKSKYSGIFSTAPHSERIPITVMKKPSQGELQTENPKGKFSHRDSQLAHQSRLLLSYNMNSLLSTIFEQKQREQVLEDRLKTTLESVLYLMKIDKKDETEVRRYLYARALKKFSRKSDLNPSFNGGDLIGKREETQQEAQEKFRIDKLLIDHYVTSQGSKKLVKGADKAASVDPVASKQKSVNLLLKWSQTEDELDDKASFCTTLFGSEKFDEKFLSLAKKHQRASIQEK
jgi:hypothetical protein